MVRTSLRRPSHRDPTRAPTGAPAGALARGRRPATQPGPATPASVIELQRLAGNRAVSALVQRQVSGSATSGFTFPDRQVGERSFGYAKAGLSVGGSYESKVTAPQGASSEVSITGGSDLSPAASKYQVEVERRFSQVASGWLAGWTPAAKVSGEATSEGGYQLALAGTLGGEHVDFTFGFSFLEADGKGELTFATLEAAATLKTYSFTFVAADGTLVSVSLKPTVKVTIEPDYAALLRFFLQRCAAVVASELALVGGVVLGGAVLIGGFVLTHADGAKMASIVDQAVIARRDYVAGFLAGATPGTDYAFDNDYKMEGHNRGSQWLRDLRAGVGREGLPVPESVVRQQVVEHLATARGTATAAINAYLHQLLVQQYWEIHWGRKWMGYPIETTFLMMMEGTGFGRPAPLATGSEPIEDIAIPAR